jgi:hypothetical protein
MDDDDGIQLETRDGSQDSSQGRILPIHDGRIQLERDEGLYHHRETHSLVVKFRDQAEFDRQYEGYELMHQPNPHVDGTHDAWNKPSHGDW